MRGWPASAERFYGQATLIPDRLDQPSFQRGEYAHQLVSAFQHLPRLTKQRPHALPVAQDRAFFDADLGIFGGAPEGRPDVRVDRLPEPFRSASHYNPFFYLIDGFRYGFIGHAEGSLMAGVGMTAGLVIAMAFTCLWMFESGYKLKS